MPPQAQSPDPRDRRQNRPGRAAAGSPGNGWRTGGNAEFREQGREIEPGPDSVGGASREIYPRAEIKTAVCAEEFHSCQNGGDQVGGRRDQS